ncbi:MAG: LysR family transcriptional regulator [Myxococcota bacterium]
MSASVDEIQVFVKVVEAESFTEAARALGMPKSTASRYVSRLEDRLGVRLLNRSTRRLHTTNVGAMYYERCVRIVRDLADAEAAITSMQDTPQGLLRVTAPLTFGYMFLDELITRFSQQHPEVQLSVFLTDRKVNLIEEGFDVAIRGGVLEDSSLIARKIGETRRVVCASPGYLVRRGVPQHPGDLKDHDCLLYGPRPSGEGSWRFADGTIVQVKGPLAVNNIDVLRRAALGDLGILYTPRFLVEKDLRSGALAPILDPFVNHAGGLYILYPHARYVSAKVRAFVDYVAANLRNPEDVAAEMEE